MDQHRFQKRNRHRVGNNGPRVEQTRRPITRELFAQLNEIDPITRETNLNGIVRQLVKMALKGNLGAIREIFEADNRRSERITSDMTKQEATERYLRLVNDLTDEELRY